ncbi:uncharacterized protein LOC111012628 [Momordica charantia]|uniref:Uncharacterized protein LOC111012628 n=1 Tax=Momordica charantia TaxID=3673 RepID=A0A6J1CL81_MOMCH|nr:uncharacterized protein LOC111012628 [Momordica charantia]XP_022142540.1 uncharacterized protein LOC111012628 [Momordica charantia]
MITPIGVAFAVGLLGWVYQALKPSPPKICGSANGPPVTSPRVKLNDGRHLAYREFGVPKEEAQYKIIMCHGYNSSKDMYLPASQELIEELKLYIVLYDRAGYGESDPYPSRSVKSEALDIQELADKLHLGTKFYVIGCSMGAYAIWSCLNYIPHRLLGASLVVPFVNYWWPSVPPALSLQTFGKLPQSYQRTFQIAHHTPWLYYWWMTQKWFPTLVGDGMFCDSDLELINRLSGCLNHGQEKITQQGEHESLNRDILAAYRGKWEFDPVINLSNPFPDNKGSVHMWQGCEDRVIPIEFNRFIAEKLPWIQYHEVPNAGHLIIHDAEVFGAIIRALLAR